MTKSGKHCGKRRNCTFCAISFFVTMFSQSCLLQRRQKASIWGKGLKPSDKSQDVEVYVHVLILSRGPVVMEQFPLASSGLFTQGS